MTDLDDPRPYYYRLRGNAVGPFALEDMQQKTQRGVVGGVTEVSRDQTDWRRATEFPELFRKPVLAPVPVVEPARTETSTPSVESGTGRWFIVLNGVQQQEPVPLATVQQYVAGGLIKKDDVVCKQGSNRWEIVRSVPELAMFVRKDEPRTESSNGLAIAGFVLSLLGLFVGCTAPLGFILSLVALNGKNQANRGLAIAGAIIGGILTALIVVVATIFSLAASRPQFF